MNIDIRYGTTGKDGEFRESLLSIVERTVGHGVLRAVTLAATFGAGLLIGWLA